VRRTLLFTVIFCLGLSGTGLSSPANASKTKINRTLNCSDYGDVQGQGSVQIVNNVVTAGGGYYSSDCQGAVVIPEGVTRIASSAFNNRPLFAIKLPRSLKTIDIGAFENASLTTITIPSNVITIGYRAFADSNIETVNFAGKSKLKSIPNAAFADSNLKGNFTIPSGVTSIGYKAFDAWDLDSITIPESVKKIDEFAFPQAKSIDIYFLGNAPIVGQQDSCWIPDYGSGPCWWGTAYIKKTASGFPVDEVEIGSNWFNLGFQQFVKAVAVTKPSIKGKAVATNQGSSKLTAVKGKWTADPAPSFTYKWYACTKPVTEATQVVPKTCTAIRGASKSTLKIAIDQKGKYIAVAVTGKNAGTSGTKWLSKSTAKVN
jgi:hypothetical protein